MPWLQSPLIQITGLALAMSVLLPIALVGGMNLPGPLLWLLWFIASYAIPIALVLWIAADMRSRGRTPPFDLPFLLLIAFPISLFWYCIWTRGWLGLLLAFGLMGLIALPAIATGWMRFVVSIAAP